MESDKNLRNFRKSTLNRFIATVVAIIALCFVLNLLHLRLDLTEDKRFTLSAPSRKILERVKNDIYIQVYLDGEMPVPLKRLKRSVRELLDEFRIASGKKIDYEFINPADTKDAGQRDAEYLALYNKGLIPIDIRSGDEEGGSMSKRVFPGMIINYNGVEVPVNFLTNNRGMSSEENILHSIEGLEYEIIQNISTVTSDTVYKVAFLEGQSEWPEIEVADITLNLARFFTIDRGSIGGRIGALDKYAAVIVAGPSGNFSEDDKLVLDQYIMNGGRVLWLFDEVAVNSDSLAYGQTVGLYRQLNIEDQLFRYGARVNPEVVQDIRSATIRISVVTGRDQKQVVPAQWLYYPLLSLNEKHPVTRNINFVRGQFVNTVDTVGLDDAIKKTVLLSTSQFSRTLSPPMVISLKEVEQIPEKDKFNKSSLPVAVLLEGVFPSAFKNRMISNPGGSNNFRLKTSSVRTKMIVVGDGDIIRNEVTRSGLNETPLSLGQDRFTGEMFGNRDFIINCMNYMVDDNGLMDIRSRELKMRLLDKAKLKEHKLRIQLVNILSPVLLVIIGGIIYNFFRKKIYSKT